MKSIPAAHTVGKTIADQLSMTLEWNGNPTRRAFPSASIYGVNYSNGTATNLSDFSKLAPLTSSSVVQLYAVKHNPFAYFASVQDGNDRDSSLANSVGFDGQTGLYADLRSGKVPDLAFIVPNQCHDQHDGANGDAFYAFDYGWNDSGSTYGTQVGLNPGLIQQGDSDRASGEGYSRFVGVGQLCSAIVIVMRMTLQRGSTTQLSGLYLAEPERGGSHRRNKLRKERSRKLDLLQ